MKKLTVIMIIAVLAIGTLGSLSIAFAADKLLDTKIESITVKNDKNGNPFARIIIKEARKLNGVAYETTVPVMVFGDLVASAKVLKAGETLKAVVSQNEYQGRMNYNVIAFIQ